MENQEQNQQQNETNADLDTAVLLLWLQSGQTTGFDQAYQRSTIYNARVEEERARQEAIDAIEQLYRVEDEIRNNEANNAQNNTNVTPQKYKRPMTVQWADLQRLQNRSREANRQINEDQLLLAEGLAAQSILAELRR